MSIHLIKTIKKYTNLNMSIVRSFHRDQLVLKTKKKEYYFHKGIASQNSDMEKKQMLKILKQIEMRF
jgi:hypothetical protein